MSDNGIGDLLTRARNAIAEAKRLSEAFDGPDDAQESTASGSQPPPVSHESPSQLPSVASSEHPAASGYEGVANKQPSPTQRPTSVASSFFQVTDPPAPMPESSEPPALAVTPGMTLPSIIPDSSHVTSHSVAAPSLQSVATRLATLQQQQSSTLNQLLNLRFQQLKLRQQQLTALQGLLSSELLHTTIDGLAAPAIQAALRLLFESLADVRLTLNLLLTVNGNVPATASLITSVSQADQRAEDASSIARHLLVLLRRQSRDSRRRISATEEELEELPVHTCTSTEAEAFAEQEATCPICLGSFELGESLSSLSCGHSHHRTCLWEWLRVSATCPICKLSCSHQPTPPADTTIALNVPDPAAMLTRTRILGQLLHRLTPHPLSDVADSSRRDVPVPESMAPGVSGATSPSSSTPTAPNGGSILTGLSATEAMALLNVYNRNVRSEASRTAARPSTHAQPGTRVYVSRSHSNPTATHSNALYSLVDRSSVAAVDGGTRTLAATRVDMDNEASATGAESAMRSRAGGVLVASRTALARARAFLACRGRSTTASGTSPATTAPRSPLGDSRPARTTMAADPIPVDRPVDHSAPVRRLSHVHLRGPLTTLPEPPAPLSHVLPITPSAPIDIPPHPAATPDTPTPPIFAGVPAIPAPGPLLVADRIRVLRSRVQIMGLLRHGLSNRAVPDNAAEVDAYLAEIARTHNVPGQSASADETASLGTCQDAVTRACLQESALVPIAEGEQQTPRVLDTRHIARAGSEAIDGWGTGVSDVPRSIHSLEAEHSLLHRYTSNQVEDCQRALRVAITACQSGRDGGHQGGEHPVGGGVLAQVDTMLLRLQVIERDLADEQATHVEVSARRAQAMESGRAAVAVGGATASNQVELSERLHQVIDEMNREHAAYTAITQTRAATMHRARDAITESRELVGVGARGVGLSSQSGTRLTETGDRVRTLMLEHARAQARVRTLEATGQQLSVERELVVDRLQVTAIELARAAEWAARAAQNYEARQAELLMYQRATEDVATEARAQLAADDAKLNTPTTTARPATAAQPTTCPSSDPSRMAQSQAATPQCDKRKKRVRLSLPFGFVSPGKQIEALAFVRVTRSIMMMGMCKAMPAFRNLLALNKFALFCRQFVHLHK